MSYCKYCGKESYGRPFCPECGKKYFGFELSIPNREIANKNENTSNKNADYDGQLTQRSQRICKFCTKSALLGSYFCEDHQQELIKKQYGKYTIKSNIIEEAIQRNLNETKYIKNNTQNRICEICGACSYNNTYCYSCYISFIKGKEYNPLKNHEQKKIYLCKSGIKVRSLSEKIISDFLTENNIPHEYEHEIKYKFTNYVYNETFIKSLHPDFYIQGPVDFKGKIIENVYIEFWGYDTTNIEYTNTKNYKIKNYKEMGITLINTNKNDLNDINQSITYKLLNFKKNKVNY